MRRPELDQILTTMLASQPEVSDLLFTTDRPPQVESYGELKPVTFDPPIEKLTPFQNETIALNIVGDNLWQIEDLIRHGSCDASYALYDKARFRLNVFFQRGNYSTVCRQLSTEIPTLKKLKFPDILKQLPREKTGLILVTGATGSGKSTTLAAILDEINHSKAAHIVTLEDPVEFLHKHQMSTFNQRELGVDFDSYANGLRAALRQAPKVILVGEMRDRVTVAHFADENDLRRLPQGGAQAVRVGIKINAEFALVERGHLVLVQKFHRVFQRHDVRGLAVVDFIQNCRQRGGFAGAGRAGDENQPGFFARKLLQNVRELEFFQSGNLRAQLAADGGIISALRKNIHAETRLVIQRVRSIARTVPDQIFNLPEIVADDVERDNFALERCQFFNGRIKSHRLEFAVRLHLRRTVGGEKQIRNFRLRSQH